MPGLAQALNLGHAVFGLFRVFLDFQLDFVGAVGRDGALEFGRAVVKVGCRDQVTVVVFDLISELRRQITSSHLDEYNLMSAFDGSIVFAVGADRECSVTLDFAAGIDFVFGVIKFNCPEPWKGTILKFNGAFDGKSRQLARVAANGNR